MSLFSTQTSRLTQPEAIGDLWSAGEFPRADYIAATAFFARLAESTDLSRRVGALLRLARALKAEGPATMIGTSLGPLPH